MKVEGSNFNDFKGSFSSLNFLHFFSRPVEYLSAKSSVVTGTSPSMSENEDEGQGVKGVFSKPSGDCIVAPNFCFLS